MRIASTCMYKDLKMTFRYVFGLVKKNPSSFQYVLEVYNYVYMCNILNASRLSSIKENKKDTTV
jgi:hypothetical protein